MVLRGSKLDLVPSVMCVSHLKDVDGCVSAALVRSATKSNILLTDYGHINQCLRHIREKYDLVYVCDLGVNPTNLEEFRRVRQFAELIYIDHHHLGEDVLAELEAMGVEVIHDRRECAGVLTFNLFRKALPREAGLLASYAAVCDRLENGPVARKILQNFDRDFVLFEASLLSYALQRTAVQFKRRVVRGLSELKYPHQIDEVTEKALAQADRIATIRRALPPQASNLEKIVYVETSDEPLGTIANLLLDVCEAAIGVCYSTDSQKQISDISIRGRSSIKIDLGKVTAQLAENLGGLGGGHPNASGARIPASKLTEFLHTLANYSK